MLSGKKAQSTLEYIIIFTAIVGVILLATNTMLKGRLTTMLNHVTNQMESTVNQINFD